MTTVRVLMVDVDGVLVRHPDGRRWDADLRADLGIDPADLQDQFFHAHFGDVLAGRADLFEQLDLVLPALGSVTSRELVDYWFAHDATLDEALLADLAVARAAGLDTHLATVQEHHRARYLWHDLGMNRRFTAMHYAADVGHRKGEPDFYRVVESRTGLAPAAHCLIDDDRGNVEVARAAGWRAAHWSPGLRLADVLASVGDTTSPDGGGEE